MAINLEPIVQHFKVENKLALAGIGAVTAALGAVAAAAGLAVNATFKWAGELDSIQDVMGVTSKEAAALNFVLRKSGTETDKLTKGMVILEKNLVKADGTLDSSGKSLADWGIQALDVNGQLKNQITLTDEIAKKYSALSTQQERVNFLTEIFGKSGSELIDVFDTLAAEGGLDKVTQKVEDLGLAIDPQKYEDFQRNLEEVKLAFLGVAITVVDSLMPAFKGINEWWNSKGLPAFIEMNKWLGANIPIAISNSKRAWEGMTTYWRTNVIPVGNETTRLFTNMNTILRLIDPQLSLQRVLWQALYLAVTPIISIYHNVTGALQGLRSALDFINRILEAGISAWNRYRSAASAPINIPSVSVPSVPSSAPGRTPARRAFGGNVMAGQTYQVNERGQEFFTPNQSGKVAPAKSTTVKISDNDLDRLGRAVARAIVPQLAKVM